MLKEIDEEYITTLIKFSILCKIWYNKYRTFYISSPYQNCEGSMSSKLYTFM